MKGLILTVSVLMSISSLIACKPNTPPTPPSSGATGTLQLTIQGLPSDADANVNVQGPEDYTKTVISSQTLNDLRTGSYTLTVDIVVFQKQSYTVQIEGEDEDVTETTVDVTEDKTTEVTVTYTSAGEVGPDDLAPGIPRSGQVSQDAFDDYAFQGVENVPLTFDFTGTSDEVKGLYSVAIYQADALDEALFESPLFNSRSLYTRPLIGFSPPKTGDYVFRIRGEEDVVDYRITQRYLNGTPEKRSQPPARLELGATAEGAITVDSYDSYLYTSSAAETVMLDVSYDLSDERYRGSYHIELYQVGQTEPLVTTRDYTSIGQLPEIELSLPGAGEYLINVVGTAPGAGSSGTSLVRYQFVLKRGE